MENNTKNHIIKKFVKISIIEGIFTQIYNIFAAPGSIFIIKFLVIYNASPMFFSLLAVFGQISQLFQPLGVIITRKVKSRKKVIIKLLIFGRSITLLFGLLPFILPYNRIILFFLLLFMISTILQSIATNAWIAWVSDIIPTRIRGRYFSARFQYILIASLVTGYIFSFLLDLYEPQNNITKQIISILGNFKTLFCYDNLPYIFLIIFIFAGIIGLISIKILSTQPEKQKSINNKNISEIFITPLKDKNFLKLLLFGFWWMLAIGIGYPFWVPFMIKQLSMSLLAIQVYGTINIISSISVVKLWGKFIDKYGNRTAMRLAILIGGFNPIIWVFTNHNTYWILYIEAISSGIMWAGVGIIGTNFVLSISPKNSTQIYSGLYAAFTGIAIIITSILSGVLLPSPIRIFNTNIHSEQILFAIAGFTRWSAEIPLSWVCEAKAKPVNEVIYSITQNIKFKIIHFSMCILNSNHKNNS